MTPEQIRLLHVDSRSLELAKRIDDLFVQSYHATAQRTSRVQVALNEALLKIANDAVVLERLGQR